MGRKSHLIDMPTWDARHISDAAVANPSDRSMHEVTAPEPASRTPSLTSGTGT